MDSEASRRANEETRAAWNRNAALWDERMGEWGNHFAEFLIWPATERLLALREGERVLDIACGNGVYARRLAARGATVLAFDFAEALVARARERTTEHQEQIQYRVVDATDEAALLALGERQFDAAICQMALFDMVEIAPLMRALPRLLRPEGRFVFSVMHPCFNSPRRAQVIEREERDGDLVTSYALKLYGYASATVARTQGISGQPTPHLLFHRPLHLLLGAAFAAGFVLDGLEEPTFPPDPSAPPSLSWGATLSEFPPVLVARLRPRPDAAPL